MSRTSPLSAVTCFFSNWLFKVDKKRRIPTNAYIFCGIFSSALSLIYIGSPLAFYAITSLGAVAMVQCYFTSIGCLLWRRIFRLDTIPAASFSLGRWGVPVNYFNWASPIFSLIIIGALIYYFITGRKRYLGPVALVEGRKEHFS
ncbi:hypothetical protein MY4038_009525 [Beauveria bassiana]